MKGHYLEFVISDVDALGHQYETSRKVKFKEPGQTLGCARRAGLDDAGLIAVRGSLREAFAAQFGRYASGSVQ